jgi:hypothetical protein
MTIAATVPFDHLKLPKASQSVLVMLSKFKYVSSLFSKHNR